MKTISYIMTMVENMNRSVEFYRDVLGLTPKFVSDNWTEFLTGSTTLALHGGGKSREKSNSNEPHRDLAGTCSIGFNVEDIQKTYNELKTKGVRFQLAPTKRESEGIYLAIATDPDGLEISFSQSLQ